MSKIWDVASGQLKLTLTGHIEQIRGWFLIRMHFDVSGGLLCCILEDSILMISYLGLAVSQRHTYMFSAGDDKQVKCWDLETNKVSPGWFCFLA